MKGNLLEEVDCRKPAEIIKIKTIHVTTCKAYPYEELNTTNRVVRSKELVSV